MGNATATTPSEPRSIHVRRSPTGPAASNHTPSAARSATTTRRTPEASRACGERICRTEVFSGFAGAFLLRRERPLAVEVFEGRDDRREEDVFVATYTSMITGRITGFLCVTSKKYLLSTLRTFCCNADGSVTWASALSSK